MVEGCGNGVGIFRTHIFKINTQIAQLPEAQPVITAGGNSHPPHEHIGTFRGNGVNGRFVWDCIVGRYHQVQFPGYLDWFIKYNDSRAGFIAIGRPEQITIAGEGCQGLIISALDDEFGGPDNKNTFVAYIQFCRYIGANHNGWIAKHSPV